MRRSLRLGILVLLGLGLAGCAWLFTPLQAVLTATPTSGTAPLSVTFSAAGSTGTIVSFTLDFQTDGTVDYTGTDITVGVNHTYMAGTYTATLTVQDNRGRTHSASVVIYVAAAPSTTASLGVVPPQVEAGDTVLFFIQAEAAPGRRIIRWDLDFETNGTNDVGGAVNTPSLWLVWPHTYVTPQTYSATLTVTDSSAQTATASVTIIVTSPPPEIMVFSATLGATTVNFNDPDPTLTITEGDTVDFDFQAQAATGRQIVKYTLLCPGSNVPSLTEEGLTGTTLTRSNILRSYSTAGTYTATLRVWDDVGNTDQATLTIEVTAGGP